MRKVMIIVGLAAVLGACIRLAPAFEKEKKRSDFKDTPQEATVQQYFWDQLHQGHYDSLPRVLDRLHAAYREDPNDFKLAAHLGFAYAWQFTEFRRQQEVRPSIMADGDLALRYFDESVELNPEDPRLLGFKAGFMLATGGIHNDDKRSTKGYFLGRKAIRMWPSFNLFSIGYVLSNLPAGHERYQEAIDLQWRNLEACLCREIDRSNPDLDDIDRIPERVAGDPLKGRACVNSWIAPHNVEGFLLNLGDMLVKGGDLNAAREVYESARRVEEFHSWPYRHKLESRLRRLEDNVELFRRMGDVQQQVDRQVFINTRFACTGCHQKSKEEFAQQNDTIPLDRNTYFLSGRAAE